jgi:hypothetical protein
VKRFKGKPGAASFPTLRPKTAKKKNEFIKLTLVSPFIGTRGSGDPFNFSVSASLVFLI